jgi:hypothetical protein
MIVRPTILKMAPPPHAVPLGQHSSSFSPLFDNHHPTWQAGRLPPQTSRNACGAAVPAAGQVGGFQNSEFRIPNCMGESLENSKFEIRNPKFENPPMREFDRVSRV